MMDQQTTMKRAAWITIGIGVVFAVSALPVLHPAVHLFLQITHWPFHDVSPDLNVPVPELVAISGGLMTGLGGMLWGLGHYVSPISERASARVTQIAAWCWFCTDSTVSILVGTPMNIVVNASFLVLMLVSCKAHAKIGARTA